MCTDVTVDVHVYQHNVQMWLLMYMCTSTMCTDVTVDVHVYQHNVVEEVDQV